jgi:uncharacterized membrane protein
MGPLLYRPALAEILVPRPRIAPAIAFYLTYPVGIVIFAVLPALQSGSTASAFATGALFGAIAYATYDLTNYATIRIWTGMIAAVDIAYGAFASAVSAAAAFTFVHFTAP